MKVFDTETGQELRPGQSIRTPRGVVRLVKLRGLLRRTAVVRYAGGNPVEIPLARTLFYPGRALRVTGTARFGR
jgi:hypothetical protein